MKVKELILHLQGKDPELEVMIQQGEEFDYMKAYTVKVKQLRDADVAGEDYERITALVIEYT